MKMKHSLFLKSSDVLACCLLNTILSNRRNSMEAQNQSELFRLSNIIGFYFSFWDGKHLYIRFHHFSICYIASNPLHKPARKQKTWMAL